MWWSPRIDDIEEVFMNPDVYSSSNVQDPLFPLVSEAASVLAAPDFDPVAVMSNRAEPDHGRIRVHTRKGFSNRRLRSAGALHPPPGRGSDRSHAAAVATAPSTSPRLPSRFPPRPCSGSSASPSRMTR